MKRRRGRYFVGSYNATHWLTVIAPGRSDIELGDAVFTALERSTA